MGPEKKDDRPFCVYHNRHSHATKDCYDLKRLREADERRPRGVTLEQQQLRRQLPAEPSSQRRPAHERQLPAETPEGYQVPRGLGCILGGAQAPSSNRYFKQLAREAAAALPGVEASRPLKWSQYPITFDSGDHPKSTSTVGGACLNVISVETFEKLQVPYKRLMPTRPFSGVTEGLTTPLGQVRLTVTFGTQANYRTELIEIGRAHV